MSGPYPNEPGRSSLIPVSPFAGNGVLGSASPANRPNLEVAPPTFRLSAAVPSANIVSIVTLSWSGRYLRLVPTDSAFISLESESQQGLAKFKRDVLAFIAPRDIPLLLIRRGPNTGPNPASTGSVRIATVLLSLPIFCPEATSQRIVGWLGRHNIMMPLPQRGYRADKRRLQSRAIETAAFGMGVMLERCREGATRQQLAQLCAEVLSAE